MKGIFTSLFILCLSGAVFSQSKVSKINNPNFKAVTLSKANIKNVQSSCHNNNPSNSQSQYLGLEKYITERLNVKQFPTSLPKAKEGVSKESYTDELYKWAKNNLSYIKPQYYQEVNNYKNYK